MQLLCQNTNSWSFPGGSRSAVTASCRCHTGVAKISQFATKATLVEKGISRSPTCIVHCIVRVLKTVFAEILHCAWLWKLEWGTGLWRQEKLDERWKKPASGSIHSTPKSRQFLLLWESGLLRSWDIRTKKLPKRFTVRLLLRCYELENHKDTREAK